MTLLTSRRIAAYTALGAPLKALALTSTLYIPAFYATDSGLGLTTVGLIFLSLRIFDIVVDPLFGSLADRTTVRIGRRRGWIALGVPVLALSIWMVFHPTHPLSLPMFIGWLALFYAAWTVVTVSHTAWASDLTSDGGFLRLLIGWREWAGIIGMLVIMIGPAIQEHHGVPLSARMGTLGDILTLGVVLAGAAALMFVPEARTSHRTPSLRQQIRQLWVSAGLRRVLLADLLVGFGYGSASALMLFVARDWLGVGAAFSTIMLVYFIGMLVSVPFWIRVADRIGTRLTYRNAIGTLALAQVLILALPAGMPILAGGLWLVQGVLTGAYQFGLNNLMAEAVERDQGESGEVLSGVYFALLVTTNKVGYACAIGVAYPLLDLLGFSLGGPGHRSHAVAVTYALIPALCFASSAWCVGRRAVKQGHLTCPATSGRATMVR